VGIEVAAEVEIGELDVVGGGEAEADELAEPDEFVNLSESANRLIYDPS
jgi:hypothetical protein